MNTKVSPPLSTPKSGVDILLCIHQAVHKAVALAP